MNSILSDRIIAYFQPILSADTHDIYGYEALGHYLAWLMTFAKKPEDAHVA
jgi:EAL domain-containing protein (putative c-di-GMP-specific phosphodiesterase class I)